MPLAQVAQAFYVPAMLPPAFGVGLEAAGNFAAEVPNYPNGCHVCEVEVDPETGAVDVARYAMVDDVGRSINPLIFEGQIHGGVAQGIGQALLERSCTTASASCSPAASWITPCRAPTISRTSPSRSRKCRRTTNPLGVKGVGEAGTIGAPPAIINAMVDALKPLGIEQPAAARFRIAARCRAVLARREWRR